LSANNTPVRLVELVDWLGFSFIPIWISPPFYFFSLSLIDYPQRMTKSDEDRPLATDLFFLFYRFNWPRPNFLICFLFFVCVWQ
jgi:hypothetical protein